MDPEERSLQSSQEGKGLSKDTLIFVSALGAALLVAVFLLVLWLFCRRRRSRRHAQSVPDDPTDLKIHTLGREYQLASLTNVAETSEPSNQPRPEEDDEVRRKESNQSKELEMLLSYGGTSLNGNFQRVIDSKERLNDTEPSDDGSEVEDESYGEDSRAPRLPQKARSTYLDDFASYFRKSSRSSQNLSMDEILKVSNTFVKTDGNAPLAKEESMGSLLVSKAPSSASVVAPGQGSGSAPCPVFVKRRTPAPRSPLDLKATRPHSEGSALYGGETDHGQRGRFAPKLPPKKKRALQHKSIASATDAATTAAPPPLLTTRSEACLFSVADDLDYDDLTPDHHGQPVLPPKHRPDLPPKQLINKSQQDLAVIENQFRTSLSELTRLSKGPAASDMDYDDLPDDEGEAVATVKATTASLAKSSEFLDYDEPIQHSNVAAAAAGAATATASTREYDEYDQDYDDYVVFPLRAILRGNLRI